MTKTPRTSSAAPGRSQIQRGATIISLVLLVVGLLGFVPGITRDFDEIRFAGDASSAQLFGLFQTSVLHNLLHLATGVLGLVCVGSALRARNYLLWTGIGYGILFLYGLLVFRRDGLNVIPIDNPDNALHLAVAGTMIACSVLLDCGPEWSTVIRRGKAEV
jgi:hypothetical protein